MHNDITETEWLRHLAELCVKTMEILNEIVLSESGDSSTQKVHSQ